MDLTPFLSSLEGTTLDQVLLSIAISGKVAVSGKVAIAMKGRFLLRSVCESFQDRTRIGCAVTDEATCLAYLAREPYELLICTDYLEDGNGFELARKARSAHQGLRVVVLALGDVIPAQYVEASWLEAVVAEADFIGDQRPLQAAVLAVMGRHSYRSPSLRSGTLPYLSCPRLTKREYEVLDLLASGLTDREIAERLVVSEETAKTYTKRLLKTLDVNNRLQAVLKGMRCGMVQL
ncbi:MULTISPECIES: response regulator transcription factor [Cyanobium]|jgi:DNA-binding NarL/FixJ family response regulator|uniref:DNA-binding response regulator n=1 Tax=Cyanobium usitatum str. Tous TaxID=2116684 RepID=A0A2P7MZA2_9CYAN|nr:MULTISPECIES: response regulator transcription factor [Cyanobium]MCP9779449.1 response regulator transcription factor [Cyanobium sp. To12R1]PSJ06524.1 DNA-binding response regulator [Cyanobium usitatum str. Tous]